jgi:hypothetical protein
MIKIDDHRIRIIIQICIRIQNVVDPQHYWKRELKIFLKNFQISLVFFNIVLVHFVRTRKVQCRRLQPSKQSRSLIVIWLRLHSKDSISKYSYSGSVIIKNFGGFVRVCGLPNFCPPSPPPEAWWLPCMPDLCSSTWVYGLKGMCHEIIYCTSTQDVKCDHLWIILKFDEIQITE